jgi:hypothetical protein
LPKKIVKFLLTTPIFLHFSSSWVAIGTHRVTQVFCSAVPISYTQRGQGTTPKDWKSLAQIILDSAYLATLLAAAIVADKRGERVTVFLTCIGGGAFGNPRPWICAAIEKALLAHIDKPLDVKLVHYGARPTEDFAKLKEKLKRKRR